ncbi:MAG: hypothetical protein GQ574_12575 [Crocinitomix sp.]|nr:hypothetical protein [Crocinitomix sp.]
MKLFKKIDDYLLHYLPSIWVTRVHSFLPIGIGLILIIYLGNLAIGWDPKGDKPESQLPVLMMIIPVLVYLVYWFIFQSRYNVSKSGGKLTILEEYLNFILYACVFTVAYGLILVVPYSNDHKMTIAVGADEVKQDIIYLNDGNSIVNEEGGFAMLDNNTFEITESNFVYDYYYYDDYDYEYGTEEEELTLTKREVLERIENYVGAYNKYTYGTITRSPEMILEDRINNDVPYDDYDYYSYYDGSWGVSNKVSKIRRLHDNTGFSLWGEGWFWKISFAFIGWLALLVWIFKQMNLRHFVFGFISLCVTPLVGGILGAILWAIFYSSYRSNRIEDLFFVFILIAYAIVAFIFIRGYKQDRLNQSAYVMSMYFNFWVPILPLFVYLSIISLNQYNFAGYYHDPYSGYDPWDVVYLICVLTGLASIALFKPVYSKFRSLPMRK